MMKYLFLILIFLAACSVEKESFTCPDGSNAADSTGCCTNPTVCRFNSECCEGSTCLPETGSTNICKYPNTNEVCGDGDCSNQEWQSGNCPKDC